MVAMVAFISTGLGQIMFEGSEVNLLNEKGRKTGTWVIFGKDKNIKGYLPEDIYETGKFVDGRKDSLWIRYYASGNKMSEITYKGGRPNGPYTTYHDKEGAVEEEGNQSGQRLVGKHVRKNIDGQVLMEKNYNDKGLSEGPQAYYHDNGTPELVWTKKNGVNNGTATRYFKNGDVKEVTEYGEDGVVTNSVKSERVNPPFDDPTPVVLQKLAPKIPTGTHIQINGEKIAAVTIPPGKQKIFLEGGDILYDGFFEKGEFKEGEFYVYDEDGLIHHIEVYKDFRFVANGVIKDL
ncbi:MAG: hypothetical protein P8M05_09605 [Flavobacteriales bacterium]|nr:hypothetical protein [Flavobacteriales bacterium]